MGFEPTTFSLGSWVWIENKEFSVYSSDFKAIASTQFQRVGSGAFLMEPLEPRLSSEKATVPLVAIDLTPVLPSAACWRYRPA